MRKFFLRGDGDEKGNRGKVNNTGQLAYPQHECPRFGDEET